MWRSRSEGTQGTQRECRTTKKDSWGGEAKLERASSACRRAGRKQQKVEARTYLPSGFVLGRQRGGETWAKLVAKFHTGPPFSNAMAATSAGERYGEIEDEMAPHVALMTKKNPTEEPEKNEYASQVSSLRCRHLP